MAITITKGFDWQNGSTVMPSRLNAAQEALIINAAANVVLGTTAAGAVIELSCTAAGRAILAAADVAAQRTLLGLALASDVQFQSLLLQGSPAPLQLYDPSAAAGKKRLQIVLIAGEAWFRRLSDDGLTVTGNSFRIDQTGDINLAGGRRIQFGEAVVTDTPTATGYIPARDGNGTAIKLLCQFI